MMTEDDAKKTRCHRSIGSEVMINCLASACMAWQWSEAKRTAAFTGAVAERMRTQKKPDFSLAMREVFAETGGQFERTEGDCGLKGRPQ